MTGDMKEGKFVAYYIKDNKVQAVSGQMNSGTVLTYLEAMHQNVMPSASDIKSGVENVETVKAKLKSNKGASKCKREHCCQKKAA